MRQLAFAAVVLALGVVASGDDSDRVLTIDHYVRVKSTVPAIAGQEVPIYARERVLAGAALRGGAGNRVALFVHGAGTPAEVAFDVPQPDYSWMAFLARAGFDVFAMDTTGYGRSFRPPAMNDPCSLLAWSLGGPRAGGYAAQHPEKVQKLVLLAPAYNRGAAAEAPAKMPPEGVPMNTQSRDEFYVNWDRQVGCPAQYDPLVGDAVWSQMLASDPVGATWGSGVRRAPQTATWGWNAGMVAKMQTPTLIVTGQHDKQVAPDRVREFYADLAAPQKVFVDLACSSHNAMWEKNRLLMFRASLEWLTSGTVNGAKDGTLRLGY
ncbi:MAG: alpha/beta fold hydrolase [Acidobacteria bacterium]|nr:alpha/beta fold hydrolase [Acidobacteriota bacterium]